MAVRGTANYGPRPQALGRPKAPVHKIGGSRLRSRGRTGSGLPCGVGKPCRHLGLGGPTTPAVSLLPAPWPAPWPDGSPTRSLWVFINEIWDYLPRTEAAAVTTASESIEGLPRGRGETILVVEDDTDIRELAIVQLEGLGYRVRVALDGKSALASLDDSPDIDLLLTDMVLPGGLDGCLLVREAERRLGHLKVLFMSGYVEQAVLLNGWVDEGADLLQKPFRRHDLAMKVRAALDRLPN